MQKNNLEKGINVLVPTYKAEKYIGKFLDSMKKQTLDYDLFEVLFVINGERDNTENMIREFIKNNPKINIKIIESEPGATTARNKGIDVLSREYVTFIDVDDFISPGYLEITYKYSAPDRIVIGNYYDIDENTGEVSETYFTESLKKFNGVINPYDVSQGALLIATNKVMPTKYIKTIKFNPNLRSGDDHEYFCRLYSQYHLEFYVVANDEDAIYYRLVVPNSVSRQGLNYDFNVIQRLEVMKEIDKLFDKIKNPNMEKLLDLTMNSSQTTFFIRYLEKYPESYPKIVKEINSYELKHFNYDLFKDKTISTFSKIIRENKTEINNLKKQNEELSNLNKEKNILEDISNDNVNLDKSNYGNRLTNIFNRFNIKK